MMSLFQNKSPFVAVSLQVVLVGLYLLDVLSQLPEWLAGSVWFLFAGTSLVFGISMMRKKEHPVFATIVIVAAVILLGVLFLIGAMTGM